MSCTRRLESPAALFLGGARGREIRVRLGDGLALVMPNGRYAPGAPSGDAAFVDEIRFDETPETPAFVVTVLSDDATPSEVFR